MLPGKTIITTDTSLKAIKKFHRKEVCNKMIDEILKWCDDNKNHSIEPNELNKLKVFLYQLKEKVEQKGDKW